MNDKVIVKKIRTELPLSKVDFCADGFTVACSGQSSVGDNVILVYDLRKSSQEVTKQCTGHMQTINSLRFMRKQADSSKKGPVATEKVSQ